MKGEKRILSLEAFQEASSAKVERPKIFSIRDRLRLAQQCGKNLHDFPALTRKTIAKQLRMTVSRLNQIMDLLKLAPEIQDKILSMEPFASDTITERALRSLLVLNRPSQIQKFRRLGDGF